MPRFIRGIHLLLDPAERRRKRLHFSPQPARIVRDIVIRRGNAIGLEVGGLLGLIVLIADVYAIVKTVQSGASTGAKVVWIVLILLLPVVGLIIWLVAGPKGG